MARQLFIEKADCVSDFTVELRFNDGTVKRVDVGVFLNKHPHPQ